MPTAPPTVEATEPAGPALPVADREALQRIRGRLVRPMPTDRVLGWVLPLLLTALAGVLRFYRITRPGGHTLTSANQIVFDETYYAHDSWSLLHHGVELNGGNTGAGFVVHPPLGKWLMAVGEAMFDHGRTVVFHGTVYPASPLSFRFSGALLGTLAVLIVARVGRRMFRSTAIGCIAGVLVALDGLEFVQSRTAMLDVYLMFWVLAAFGCLVLDRDAVRRRLADRLTAPLPAHEPGPLLGAGRWRWAAGLCLGAACATKWDGAFFLPALLVLAVAWDVGARRIAGAGAGAAVPVAVRETFVLVPFVVVPAAVYVASWTGWFLSDARFAYDHDKFVHAGQSWFAHDWSVFRGWWSYQREIFGYADNLTWDKNPHPYLSRPWGWMVLARPVAYYYQTPKGCGAGTCSQEVLGVGNPAVWWGAIPALLAVVWAWIARRDWRAAGIVLMFAAGYLPWFREDGHHRVMFLFYMLPVVPFMALAVAMALGMMLGGNRVSDRRRIAAVTVSGGYLALVVMAFGYLYPVLSAQTIPYSAWHSRMLFRGHCQSSPNTHEENAPCWI